MSRVSYQPCNMVAVALPASIPVNANRKFLTLVTTAATTVTISGGASFIVDGVWAPIPAPLNDIAFAGAGTLITG